MTNDFIDFDAESSSTVNPYYTGRLDTSSSIASDLFGGAVATVADFGTSVFNSLTPSSMNFSTEEVLRNISNDALRVYQENPDTIHTLSFVGGMFVPAGLALKGLNTLRNGAKGVSLFADTFGAERRAADLVKLEELTKGGAAASAQLRELQTSIYLRGAASQVIDAAAMEAAVVATMSAHPFMEDYLEDPVKNFALSATVGGVLGSGIGHIADRFAVRQVMGGAVSSEFKNVVDRMLPVPEGVALADAIQVRQTNINSIRNMLQDEKAPLEGLGKEFAEKILLREQEKQMTELEKFASKLTANATQEEKAELLSMFANDMRFQHIDKAKKVLIKEKILPNNNYSVELEDDFANKFVTKLNKSTLENETTADARVYFPEAGAFGNVKDVAYLGRASSLKGVTVESISEHKLLGKTAILAPNNENGMLLNRASSPTVDRMYAEALTYVDQLDLNTLSKAAVAPDDLPMLQAIVARIANSANDAKNPGALQNLEVTVTKMEPRYTTELRQAMYKKGGLPADYEKRLQALTSSSNSKITDPRNNGISMKARELLEGWTSGNNVARMRSVADAWMYKGYGEMSLHPDYRPYLEAFGEIYNSKGSVAFRNSLKEIADSEGNVYLLRGHKGQVVGHAGLTSYTGSLSKASEFVGKQGIGHTKIYKVHVDDVVAQIVDTGGGGMNEIIVRAPKRATEPMLPIGIQGQEAPASVVAAKTVNSNKVGAAELIEQMVRTKQALVDQLLEGGRSPLEVAIRSGTPQATIESYLMHGKTGDLREYGNIIEYTSPEAIKSKLGLLNQPIHVSSNIKKQPWAAYSANMDVAAANRISQEVTNLYLLSAKNLPMASSIRETVFSEGNRKILDIVRSQVSNAVNDFAGNRFLQSADSFMAHMKDLGSYASYMGKELADMSNKTIGRMLAPITGSIEKISKDVVARTELNHALHLSASTKGWHIYDKGQFWIKENVTVEGKTVEKLRPIMTNGAEFKVINEDVDKLLTQFQNIGRELYGTRNLVHKILGKANLNDRGFWVPSFNPKDKFIAYLHNKATATTQLIVGNTEEELKAAIAAIRPSYTDSIANGTVSIFTKSDQSAINLIAGRDDPVFMSIANAEKLHSGSSAQAIVKTNADPLADVIQGLEHSVKSLTTSLAEVSLYDISNNLQHLSAINQHNIKNQPLNRIKAAIMKPKDAAADVRDIMFDLKSLPSYTTWQDINSGFEGVLGYIMNKVTAGWNSVYKATGLSKEFKLDYDAYAKLLQENGAANPFAVYGEQAEAVYGLSDITGKGNQAKRLVTLSNSYAATAALRFGDLAQPLVNAMSLPILMTSAIADKMPATFMGAKLAGTIGPAQAMADGIRAMHNPAFARWDAVWKARGYYNPVVSEATEVLKMPRELTPGLMTTLEKAAEHKIVNMVAAPADYAETMTRKVSMYTGATLAKRLYPTLGDEGITIFARNFTDRVIGNYHSAQRPIFFQGTMGTAMGLFQTYMLTFAQQMYKHLELKDYKALGKMMLAQTTVFGAGSLPGFAQVSEAIGEHYSDDHIDLETGTIRAVSDPVAKAVLYGLPSSLGPAFYTRGELAPRVSTPANLTALPPLQMIGQTVSTVGAVAGAIGDENALRSMGQALALQSVSRPLARAAELATGYSTTQQGTTVSTPEEVWSFLGIASRVLGTRPTQEALVREVNYMNRHYESFDRDNRQKVVNKLRTAVRAGDIDSVDLEKLALDYMDNGGSPTGWRSAVRTAIMTTDVPMTEAIENKLKDDSALNHMIDMLDE